MAPGFIRAAEVWLPSADGTLLEFGAGAFGAARRFAATSKAMCFGRGEGLPGRAWDEEKPIVLRSVEDPYFRRTAAATAAGLTCAVALPLFPQGRIRCVLVLFCSHGEGRPAALELWHGKPDIAAEMTLAEGVYGAQGHAFEADSRQTSLPRGTGLPGLAWQRGAAIFVEDLTGDAERLVRASGASAAGLQRGLAIPASWRRDDPYVVAFLGSREMPLASGIERWVPNADHTALHRELAFREGAGRLSAIPATLPLTDLPRGSSIVRAWSEGVAAINEHPREEPGAPAASAAAFGAAALVAIPVVWEGEIVEVVALYL
jgi:hypothetical protein